MPSSSDSDAGLMAKRAYSLQASGDVVGAIDGYRQLLHIAPKRPDDWYNLGFLQKQAGLFDDSLVSYQSALDHGIDAPEEVHLNRAVIYVDALRQPEAAARELGRALAINPEYVPALLNLGNLHEDRGAKSEALHCYQSALEIDPDSALALARVADVSEIGDANHPLVKKMEIAFSRPQISPLDQADIGFALGRLFDSIGEYESAYRIYSRANRASNNIGKRRYSAASTSAMMSDIAETFFEPVAPVSDNSSAPIFICGMFRSGSSLVERILAAHSELQAGGELEIVPTMAARQLNPYPKSLKDAEPDIFNRLREHYLANLKQIGLDASSVTDKQPDNFLHIGLIKKIFPDARIVHTVRNPLDNCLSIFFAHLDPRMTYAQSLESAAHWYQEYRKLMMHWKQLYPSDIHDVSYDKLVTSPRTEIESLLKFCDLEWEEACLSPHSVTGLVRTASSWQVREPLYQRSSGRHKNYQCYLGKLVEVFGKEDS